MTTRACSKSVVVGVVPPNSPTATCSYSNGRLIHFLETSLGTVWPSIVMTRRARVKTGFRRPASRGAAVVASALASSGSAIVASACTDTRAESVASLPQLCASSRLEPRGAAEMRHVGHDLQRVAMAADLVAVELRLHARLVDEILRRAAAEHDRRRPRPADDDVRRFDDVADDVDVAFAGRLLPGL